MWYLIVQNLTTYVIMHDYKYTWTSNNEHYSYYYYSYYSYSYYYYYYLYNYRSLLLGTLPKISMNGSTNNNTTTTTTTTTTTSSLETNMLYLTKGNHPNINIIQNPELVQETMNNKENISHVLPFFSWLMLVFPHVYHVPRH